MNRRLGTWIMTCDRCGKRVSITARRRAAAFRKAEAMGWTWIPVRMADLDHACPDCSEAAK